MKLDLRVALLGGGSWGTTVGSIASRNANVTLWARNKKTVNEINQNHANPRYLPDIKLPNSLRASTDLEKTVSDCDVLVVGVPSSSFRDVLKATTPYLSSSTPIISLTKGLEKDTDLRMSQLIEEICPNNPNGVLTGPNLAREIMNGKAAASVIAMHDPKLAAKLQPIFHNGLFRVYTCLLYTSPSPRDS